MKDKKYRKVRDQCHYTGEYRGAAHRKYNLKRGAPRKIRIAFHNRSYYDYHFIIKELPEEFKKQFTCLGGNTEKYITFIVPTEKVVTRIDKSGEEVTKKYILHITIYCFLKEFVELNVNTDTIIKNVKYAELNINIATISLNIQTLKMIK